MVGDLKKIASSRQDRTNAHMSSKAVTANTELHRLKQDKSQHNEREVDTKSHL